MYKKSYLLEAEPKQTQTGNKAQIFNRRNDWLLEQSVMACDGPFVSQVFHAITGYHMEEKLMPNTHYQPLHQPGWVYFNGLWSQTSKFN